MLRAIATRAASICRVSSQQRSKDINPYSPNATVWPREARPARLPRCILRYFTLSGISGIGTSWEKLNQWLGGDWFGHWLGLDLRGFGLAFANPAFDPQLAIHGIGFGKTVFNISPKGVQWHTAPVILFDTRQFSAAQAA